MKEGWIVKKLTDVCYIQYGYAFDSSCFCDDKCYPQLIRIRDVVRGYSETYYKGDIPDGYYIDKGDYLIGMDGEFNIAPWKSERALLNQRVCKISSINTDVLDRFIYYDMCIILNQIEEETPFVTVKHLSAKRLNKVYIPIPPLPEQTQIVEELDQLSNIIEKKRLQLSELDNLAQSIFYDMFGDPVTNEKGWEVKNLGDVCKSDLGKTLNQSKDKGEYHHYLCAINILWGYINLNNLKQARFENIELEKYSVRKGDLLICEGGDVGRAAIWNEDKPMLYQNALHRVRFDKSIVAIYALYWLQCLKKDGELDKYVKGVTIKHLVKSSLLSIPICIPPLSLQQFFAQKIEAIEKEKELIKQSIKETEELFNSRMDYYFG